jgi:hypothetical protein
MVRVGSPETISLLWVRNLNFHKSVLVQRNSISYHTGDLIYFTIKRYSLVFAGSFVDHKIPIGFPAPHVGNILHQSLREFFFYSKKLVGLLDLGLENENQSMENRPVDEFGLQLT